LLNAIKQTSKSTLQDLKQNRINLALIPLNILTTKMITKQTLTYAPSEDTTSTRSGIQRNIKNSIKTETS